MSNRSIGLALSLSFHAALIAGIVSWNQPDSTVVQSQGAQAMKLSVSMFEEPEPEKPIELQPEIQPLPQQVVTLNKSTTPALPVTKIPEPKKELKKEPSIKPKPKTKPAKVEAKQEAIAEPQAPIDSAQKSDIESAAQLVAGSGQSNENQQGLENAYKKAIQQAILKYRKYPRQARRKRAEGTVTVFLQLERDGNISELRVLQSSGVEALDKAALQAVQRVETFLPFPKHVEKASWDFEFPVTFKLN